MPDMEKKTSAIFIAIDGIDGSGKTTLSSQLAQLLAAYDPLLTKEPTGDSEWGRRLRASAQEGRLDKETEIEYFHKDRLHHLKNDIIPALSSGRVVICDRYVDSTLAFQAENPQDADYMYNIFSKEILIPDICFILQCPVKQGLARIAKNRTEISTFEIEETLDAAAGIYSSRLKKGLPYVALDATGSIDHTFNQARDSLKRQFPQLFQP